MRERKKLLNKNKILTIWIVIAAFCFAGIVSYAAYTSTHTAKSVITTRGDSGVPFSSNYLSIGSSENAEGCAVPINGAPILNVNICNYSQDNLAKFFTSDIPYKLTATLVDSKGRRYAANGDVFDNTNTLVKSNPDFDSEWYREYSVNGIVFDESLTIEFEGANHVLEGYVNSTDDFELRFPVSQFTDRNVYIKLVAEPDSSVKGKNGISTLSGYLGIVLKDTQKKLVWRGYFSDSSVNQPERYDGFNYVVSGNGNAEITLTWNTDYVEISKWAFDKLNEGRETAEMLSASNITVNGNKKSIVFTVDSSKVNSYSLQFYRTTAADVNEEWIYDENLSQIAAYRQSETVVYPFVEFSAESITVSATEASTSSST